jgi:hypothetical protein
VWSESGEENVKKEQTKPTKHKQTNLPIHIYLICYIHTIPAERQEAIAVQHNQGRCDHIQPRTASGSTHRLKHAVRYCYNRCITFFFFFEIFLEFFFGGREKVKKVKKEKIKKRKKKRN